MADTYDLMNELELLDPHELRFFLDEFEELHLERNASNTQGPLRARRAFPITAVGDFVVIHNAEGEEVGVLRRVNELDERSRQVLQAELDRTYFTSEIVCIHAIEVEYHVPHWQVDTDRGPRSFELRSGRRDLRVLLGGRILVRDADGNRYEIPDYRQLDVTSRALIEAQI